MTALVVLALAACSSPAAGVSTPPSPSPTHASPSPARATPSPRGAGNPAGALFAVLEARGPGSHSVVEPGVAGAADTVAIVGLDGFARAKATFDPRAVPRVGNAIALMQPEARVAGGAVYYLDGHGVVRRLAVGSPAAQVADFPITNPQQEVSFAVSPDGTRLIAASLQLPAVSAANGPAGFDPSAHWRQTLFQAPSGGPVTTVWTRDLGTGQTAFSQVLALAGWDRVAPVAVLQAQIGTQTSTGGRLLAGQHLSRLDGVGEASAPLGNPDCLPWSELAGGTVLCVLSDYHHPSVRSASGTVLWIPPAGCAYPAGSFPLSPDGKRITCSAPGGDLLIGSDGSSTVLPSGFQPEGWLDDRTLIGNLGAGGGAPDLATLTPGGTVNDLGFKGEFVGVVSG